MERRSEVREPIRLKVTFKSLRALLSEYTTSVSKGGCTIRSPNAIDPETVFIFALTAEGRERKSIEIEGRVTHSTARTDGGFDVGISYVSASSPRRVATTRFLDEVFAEKLAKRHHARVPVNLIAEDAERPLRYLVRDLSRGGMGLKLAVDRELPATLALGQRVQVSVIHDGDIPFVFFAVIVRLEPGTAQKKQPSIGVHFVDLDEANSRVIDALLYLHRPQLIQLKFFDS